MFKHAERFWGGKGCALFALLTVFSGGERLACSQDLEYFLILSGTYEQRGGFVPGWIEALPNSRQTLVALSINRQTARADLTFLNSQLVPNAFPRLTNGVVSGELIRFQYFTAHPVVPQLAGPAWVDYTVTNLPGCLSLSGCITSAPVCCDIPYWWGHRAVQALPHPVVSICQTGTPHAIALAWKSNTNLTYQVQWRSDLDTNAWTNLGLPVRGNGTTNCFQDAQTDGQVRKYYRVCLVPGV